MWMAAHENSATVKGPETTKTVPIRRNPVYD